MSAPFIERIPREPDDAVVDAYMSQKGGPGKTTLAVNTAAVVAENTPKVQGAEDAPVVAATIDPMKSMEVWAKRVREDALPFDYLSTGGDNTILPALKKDPSVKRICVDTPGFVDMKPGSERARDPLGDGAAGDALRVILAIADRVVVPINPEFLTLGPAEFTIERVLKPLGIPFLVVLNKYEPRDEPPARPGQPRTTPVLDKYMKWIIDHGYPHAPLPVRRYRLHADAAEKGLVCTRYKSSGTALRARQDIQNFALALDQVPF